MSDEKKSTPCAGPGGIISEATLSNHEVTAEQVMAAADKASPVPQSPAARLEMLQDMYAPYVEQPDGTRKRDPAFGIISREDFMKAMDFPDITGPTPTSAGVSMCECGFMNGIHQPDCPCWISRAERATSDAPLANGDRVTWEDRPNPGTVLSTWTRSDRTSLATVKWDDGGGTHDHETKFLRRLRTGEAHHVLRPETWTAEETAKRSGLYDLVRHSTPDEAVRIAFMRGWARATDHHEAKSRRERDQTSGIQRSGDGPQTDDNAKAGAAPPSVGYTTPAREPEEAGTTSRSSPDARPVPVDLTKVWKGCIVRDCCDPPEIGWLMCTGHIDGLKLRERDASLVETCAGRNACVADSDWGCEARKKLGIARGALLSARETLATILNTSAKGEGISHWEDCDAYGCPEECQHEEDEDHGVCTCTIGMLDQVHEEASSAIDEVDAAVEGTGQPQPCVPAGPSSSAAPVPGSTTIPKEELRLLHEVVSAVRSHRDGAAFASATFNAVNNYDEARARQFTSLAPKEKA